jgi:hypothetical protein
MKDMTTAEFAKANLAALEEPVKIRRYTKAVGTYYPEGYIAALPGETVPRLDFEFTAAAVDVAVAKVKELEEEVKRLKKELAARPLVVSPAAMHTTAGSSPVGSEFVTQERRTVPQHPMKDVFADLAKQDREFFERKLGTGKKK